MFNLFKNLFKEKYNTGVLPDNRPASEKAKDYQSDELYVTSGIANFRKVGYNEWKKYLVRNQDGSGSCVANTVAKILEVAYYLKTGKRVKFSHAPIYIHRENKPAAGMSAYDALKLAVKYSSCREEDMPSENMNDAQLDALRLPSNYEDLNNLVAPKAYYSVSVPTFYNVADTVARAGSAMIFVNTDYSNWCKDFPTAGGRDGGVRHSITAVDMIEYNGVKYLVIEDSWGKFGAFDGQRLLDEKAFNYLCYYAGALVDFIYDFSDVPNTPKFTKVMVYGERSDDVRRLQDFLKTQGVLPTNIDSTGFYGQLTAQAVYLFQVKNNVAPLSELNALKGVRSRVGTKTLAVINSLLK